MNTRIQTYFIIMGTLIGTWLALLFMVAMSKLTIDLFTAIVTCG